MRQRPIARILLKLTAGILFSVALLAAIELLLRPYFLVAEEPAQLPPKQPGTFRIVALGGSTVAGEPVYEMGFVKQLGALLHHLEPSKPLEVINLGRPGKDSTYALRVVEEVSDDDVDLLIVLAVHNEYFGERAPRRTPSSRLKRLALYQALKLGMPGSPVSQEASGLEERLEPYPRGAYWFQERKEIFRSNLREIVATAQRHRIPLILCTGQFNIADWPPIHQKIAWVLPNPNYDADNLVIWRCLDEKRLEDGLEQCDRLLMKYGDDAMMLFLKGNILRRQGQFEKAYDLFVQAKDLDPFPWRAMTEFNDEIRSYQGKDGLILVDMEEAMERHAKDRMVGFELIADGVHPTPLGGAVMATELAAAMAAHHLFLKPLVSLPLPTQWSETFLESIGNKKMGYLRIACLKNAEMCIQSPFFFYRGARMYLNQALELSAMDWEAWAMLACVNHFEGNVGEARAHLKKAEELKGSPLTAPFEGRLRFLPEALTVIRRPGAESKAE